MHKSHTMKLRFYEQNWSKVQCMSFPLITPKLSICNDFVLYSGLKNERGGLVWGRGIDRNFVILTQTGLKWTRTVSGTFLFLPAQSFSSNTEFVIHQNFTLDITPKLFCFFNVQLEMKKEYLLCQKMSHISQSQVRRKISRNPVSK